MRVIRVFALPAQTAPDTIYVVADPEDESRATMFVRGTSQLRGIGADGASDFTIEQGEKLAGIATGATANDTDAALRDRATHTGTQEASTITGLAAVATTGAYSDLSGLPSLFSGAYGDLTGIPGTFTPSAHDQAWSTITATPTTLAGYGITDAATSAQGALAASASQPGHTHAQADVTGLDDALAGKAATSHGHVISDTTGLQAALDGKQPLATVLTNTTAAFTTAQETKLAGIASGATVNSADATLLARANHTGTQAASTISDFAEAVAATAAVTANTAKVSNATHTGDATGSTALTLATVNSNVGNFGSATQVATFTVNAKGLTTAAGNTTISIPASQISDFATAVAATAAVTANTAKVTNATHTGDVTGATALTIANDAVTNAKLANMAANTVKVRAASSSGDPSDLALSASQLLGRGASGDVAAITLGTNLSMSGTTLNASGGGGVSDGDKGDITVSGSGATWTIDNGAVSLAKMADLATARIIGRNTAGTGAPESLTGTQATALLDTFTSGAKGLTPASGGGTTNFLRADGSWSAPPSGSGSGWAIRILNATQSMTNDTSVQDWFASAGSLPLDADSTYEFEGHFFSLNGSTSHGLNMQFAAVSGASIQWNAIGTKGAAATEATAHRSVSPVTFATNRLVTTASTVAGNRVRVWGTIRTGAAGALVPRVAQSAASGSFVVQPGTFFKARRIGAATLTNTGEWE